MNLRFSLLSLGLLASIPAHGQVTITAADMFNEVGLYYRAYGNDSSTSFITGGQLMGSAGTNRFWDFSSGPTNQVLRFDYLSATNVAEAADCPQATIAERKTVESTGETSWLFFQQVPSVGRKVYGFYDEQFSAGILADSPSFVFSSPFIDFPDVIHYGDIWISGMTAFTSIGFIDPEDPEGPGSAAAKITWSSTFKVDAWGVVDLPGLGFADALRVNEEETIAFDFDFEGTGQFQNLETDYVRNYYWLQPGHGIVAQLNSVQGTGGTFPPENFPEATAFVRMFETNKKASAGCTNPDPVTDLSISMDNSGRVLLKWTKAQCATQYRVEYTTDPSSGASWQALGTPSVNIYLLDTTASQDLTRFYRVVSLK